MPDGPGPGTWASMDRGRLGRRGFTDLKGPGDDQRSDQTVARMRWLIFDSGKSERPTKPTTRPSAISIRDTLLQGKTSPKLFGCSFRGCGIRMEKAGAPRIKIHQEERKGTKPAQAGASRNVGGGMSFPRRRHLLPSHVVPFSPGGRHRRDLGAGGLTSL